MKLKLKLRLKVKQLKPKLMLKLKAKAKAEGKAEAKAAAKAEAKIKAKSFGGYLNLLRAAESFGNPALQGVKTYGFPIIRAGLPHAGGSRSSDSYNRGCLSNQIRNLKRKNAGVACYMQIVVLK